MQRGEGPVVEVLVWEVGACPGGMWLPMHGGMCVGVWGPSTTRGMGCKD